LRVAHFGNRLDHAVILCFTAWAVKAVRSPISAPSACGPKMKDQFTGEIKKGVIELGKSGLAASYEKACEENEAEGREAMD